jgi:septum formation inhibitor MinC
MTQLFADYVEPTDLEWDINFAVHLASHKRRLDNGNLTIAELIEEQEDGVAEAFAYFLGLTPERQQRCAPLFREGLAQLKAAKEKTREKAQQMLAKRGVLNGR